MATMNRTYAFTGRRLQKFPWRYDEIAVHSVKGVLEEQITTLVNG